MPIAVYRCAECEVMLTGEAGRDGMVLLCCYCLHFPGWPHDSRLQKAILAARCDPCCGVWLDAPLPQFVADLARGMPKKGAVL